MKFSRLLVFFCALLTLSSCLVKNIKIDNPCTSKEWITKIDKASLKKQKKLENKLLRNISFKDEACGCQAAILAKLYLKQNRFGDAALAYAMAAQKLPRLSDYFLLAQAKSELKNQKTKNAKVIANSLERSKLSSFIKIKLDQLLADIALMEKDQEAIVSTHRKLLYNRLAENEENLFNLASSLSSLGQDEEANQVFKQLLIRYPSSAQAKIVPENVQKTLTEKLSLEEQSQRFDNMIGKLDFDSVVQRVDERLSQGTHNQNPSDISTLNGYAVKALVFNNKAQMAVKRAQLKALNANATAKDLETYAWALAKVDRFLEAADYYTRFSQKTEEKELKAKGCFFSGFSLYEAGFYNMAQFAWAKCENLVKNTSYYENLLWYRALSYMVVENHAKAFEGLDFLTDNFPSSNEIEKYLYFKFYSLNKLNKKTQALAGMTKLSNKSEPTYYVMLARQFLGLRDPMGQNIGQKNLLSPVAKTCAQELCKDALTLFHLGFIKEAKDMILKSTLPEESKMAALNEMGDFHKLWQKSYLFKPKALVKDNIFETNKQIRFSYPLAHQPIVNKMSKKYRINDTLIYAIMRTESGFDHDAESYRGALGLMQMMPFVAKDLAGHIAIDNFDAELLKNPEISLELGTLFVASLKRKFGETYLAAAAYNAGSHQVDKWIAHFGYLPKELFIERIPFEQSRNYVKKILPTQSLYAALKGQPLKLNF